MTRIAVGGFLHETNTFALTKATYDAFVHGGGFPRMELGKTCWKTCGASMWGWRVSSRQAGAEGWDLVPTILRRQRPVAHVTEDAFERIARR